jgi:hypothetical protein
MEVSSVFTKLLLASWRRQNRDNLQNESVQGTFPLHDGHHYWEVKILTTCSKSDLVTWPFFLNTYTYINR